MIFRTIWIAALVVSIAVTTAHAASQRALVIGIDEYDQVVDLQKALNDASSIATSLERVGFEVTVAEDVNRRSMNRAIEGFLSTIEPGDVALLYYAGHGVEIDGRNYLLPADIPSENNSGLVKSEAISLSDILQRISASGARITLAIIDACRDNPFHRPGQRSLGASRGLGMAVPPEGTFVLYSAGVGQAALDRLGDSDSDPNSVFTRSLLRLLEEPGLEIRDLAIRLRREVRQTALSISHMQTPAYYDELIGDFSFIPQEEPVDSSADDIADEFLAASIADTVEAWSAFVAKWAGTADPVLIRQANQRLEALSHSVGEAPGDKATKGLIPVVVTECDRFATLPPAMDQNAVVEGPVTSWLINSELAVRACREAVVDYPAEPRLQFHLGNSLFMQNDPEAVDWIRRAAQREYPAALNLLGYFYTSGTFLARDRAKAITLFQEAADKGDLVASLNIGLYYKQGFEVERDYTKAREWFDRAAEQGFGSATRAIGNLYRDGQGVPQDDEIALEWYRRAAKQNDTQAMIYLGDFYREGRGAKPNQYRSQTSYWQAAKLGDPIGMYHYAISVSQKSLRKNPNYHASANWLWKALQAAPVSISEEISERPNLIPREVWKIFQERLREEGYYNGPIDGLFGPQTQAALERVEKN